jgi:hypothetical protein
MEPVSGAGRRTGRLSAGSDSLTAMVLTGAQVDSTDPLVATDKPVQTPADGQSDDIVFLRGFLGR